QFGLPRFLCSPTCSEICIFSVHGAALSLTQYTRIAWEVQQLWSSSLAVNCSPNRKQVPMASADEKKCSRAQAPWAPPRTGPPSTPERPERAGDRGRRPGESSRRADARDRQLGYDVDGTEGRARREAQECRHEKG